MDVRSSIPYRWLRAAWLTTRTWRRFRDPSLDFKISSDRVRSYSLPPKGLGAERPHTHVHGDFISLHLASDPMAVQSVMNRTTPDRLLLGYTEIMAGFPKFRDSPRRIGMIGLGGGSLTKYCYNRFPDCHITVAEISREVIDLRREFRVPDDDSRLDILHIDGAELVRRRTAAFDVLMVDAFDGSGFPAQLTTPEFYRDCREALSGDGVLIVNFAGFDWRTWFGRLDVVFRRRAVVYRCPEGNNIITFASKGPLPAWTMRS